MKALLGNTISIKEPKTLFYLLRPLHSTLTVPLIVDPLKEALKENPILFLKARRDYCFELEVLLG